MKNDANDMEEIINDNNNNNDTNGEQFSTIQSILIVITEYLKFSVLGGCGPMWCDFCFIECFFIQSTNIEFEYINYFNRKKSMNNDNYVTRQTREFVDVVFPIHSK